MATTTRKKPNHAQKPKVALILQGGGALGAYHIGAYQALHEAGYEPDWISGISIGAINACILAGNEPEDRLSKLETLWREISRPGLDGFLFEGEMRRLYNQFSYLSAVMLGQPNFWQPRFPSPLMLSDMLPQQASYCDTAAMLATLQRLSSFDLINKRTTRLSLGATKVTTGELVFFDNHRQKIGPEHVLASGSLPPGFPATEVDGELYWDGGCVSNTPLDAIFEDEESASGHTLIFMVDLWDANGLPPNNMGNVSWRQKQIMYASRTRQNICAVACKHNQRRALHEMAKSSPASAAKVSNDLRLHKHNEQASFDIVHLIYHPASDQIADSDAEFSRTSIIERRDAGYSDMQGALDDAPWQRYRRPSYLGTAVHTVRKGEVHSACPT
ncbi:patatin-like phospholipase family protein [Chitinimonas sp. PSY-7]|uniref:patatin-like phospholipase family protein n=1 Tax=Chitinimonas sp. PSY-7 TaxID=3459088 RepID=UPI00403FE3FD